MKAVILAAGRGTRLIRRTHGQPKGLLKLLGLRLFERILFPLNKAGVEQVYIVMRPDDKRTEEVLRRTRISGLELRFRVNPRWEKGNGTTLAAVREDLVGEDVFLVVMSDHLFHPALIPQMVDAWRQEKGSYALIDPDPDRSIDLEDATKVSLAVDQVQRIGKNISSSEGVDCGLFLIQPSIFECLDQAFLDGEFSLNAGIQRYSELHQLKAFRLPPHTYWQDIDTPGDLKQAKKKLLRSLTGRRDGFIARWLNRPISRRLTRFISSTRIGPNAITTTSFAIALASGACFAVRWSIAGGLFAQFASIMDGVDGEISRLKFSATPFGELYDAMLDRYGDAIILLGMGYAAYHISGPWTLLPTALALLASPFSMMLIDRYQLCFGERFDRRVLDGIAAFLPWSRDGRLFLIMIGGILGWITPTLILLAILSNALIVYRLLRIRVLKKKMSQRQPKSF